MTEKEFISHLYKKLWKYIILERNFKEYWRNEPDGDYDPAYFYSDHIPELITNLKSGFAFIDSYNEIVSDININVRPVIIDFMAWFSFMEDKSEGYIYNSFFRNQLNLKPLNELIRVVQNAPSHKTKKMTDSKHKLDTIFMVIERFTSATKSLTSRRKGKRNLNISDEYDVQDIIHTILKPFVPLIKNEEVVPGNDVNKFLKIDFLLPLEKTALECKYVRDLSHTKKITKELNDDIQTYIHHQDCNNLIFFIYDKELLISNPDSLEKKYTQTQSIKGKTINIYLKIRPKN